MNLRKKTKAAGQAAARAATRLMAAISIALLTVCAAVFGLLANGLLHSLPH